MSPAQILLECPRFRETQSEESVRDLHRHSEVLLSDAWPNSNCARIARNQVLSSVIKIIEAEFSETWAMELCDTVCKGWEQDGSRWRALVVQEGYCSLDHPPPAGYLENIEDFEDSEGNEADFSNATEAVDSAIAKCEEIQRTPEIVDLVRKGGYMQERDRYKACDLATAPLSEDLLVSDLNICDEITEDHIRTPPSVSVSIYDISGEQININHSIESLLNAYSQNQRPATSMRRSSRY